jgi:hypothetical protein
MKAEIIARFDAYSSYTGVSGAEYWAALLA